MSTNIKNIDFPKVNYDEWKEAATKAIKGKPFESLFTKTTEEITLEPIYTQEMLVKKLGDQLDKQVSTIRSLKASSKFQAAQQIFGETTDQFFNNLQDSVTRGNHIVTIDSRTLHWDDENLSRLAKIMTENPFKLIVQSENDPLLSVFDKINVNERQNVKGYILSNGKVRLEGFPSVRTWEADITTYHYEGANAVQELAIALALAAKYAKEEENYESFASQFFVNFAIDTQFFQEIAKLRAFKVMWKAFSSAFGVDETIPVPILAETSLRSFSKLDIYVNLLRAGNEALSGLIGGADILTVHPHDVLTKPTDQSIRIARNVILVLNEESQVAEVLDPSGGSYFIESLTADYVERAWSLFLEIEAEGGIDQFVGSGKLQSALEEVNKSRVKAVQTRKHSLIGTNIYANPVDKIPSETNPLFVNMKRLASSFENIRELYNNENPKIAILTYGKLKNIKPRVDFVTGIFATAGVVADTSGEIDSIEKATLWLKQCENNYVIVAATDDDTKELVPALLEEKTDNLILDVAGKYKDEETEWLSKGLNGFIFAGQNIVEKLNEVLVGVKGVQQ